MAFSITTLRSNLYKIIDQVIATGIPIEIERKGKLVKIIIEDNQLKKLDNLSNHPGVITCDPDEMIGIDKINICNKTPEMA